MTSPTDWVTEAAESNEDQADHHEDDADGDEDGQLGEQQAKDYGDNSHDDHG
jgi:hypothetical protein